MQTIITNEYFLQQITSPAATCNFLPALTVNMILLKALPWGEVEVSCHLKRIPIDQSMKVNNYICPGMLEPQALAFHCLLLPQPGALGTGLSLAATDQEGQLVLFFHFLFNQWKSADFIAPIHNKGLVREVPGRVFNPSSFFSLSLINTRTTK